MVVPRLDTVVARRQGRALRHDAGVELTGEPPLPSRIPTVLEQLVVRLHQIERRLVWRVAGTERHVTEPRTVRITGVVVGEHRDGVVDQIRGQVVAVLERPGWWHERVVADGLG